MVEGQAKAARPRSPPRSQPAPDGPRRPGGFAVVGIGASAGGLDACTKLLDALPAGNGMAFILVQHLDPTHESMMVDLLAGHTAMTVRQATDGMLIEREHLYVIPPGTYLSVGTGALHLSPPQARHGARLPFDFLLHSLAEECGARAICVILSGTGADGSLGLKAVKESGGLVIAQDPDEAGYDGMPRNAIMTGAVDLVLPVAKIPEALVKHDRRMALTSTRIGRHEQDTARDWLPEIIDLLRTKTAHDFTLYKRARCSAGSSDAWRWQRSRPTTWIGISRSCGATQTSSICLPRTCSSMSPASSAIAKVFDLLAEKIVPDLVRGHSSDQPLRIWIAGCSTGEETYSLAMLFLRGDLGSASATSSCRSSPPISTRMPWRPPEKDVTRRRSRRMCRRPGSPAIFLKEEQGYRVAAGSACDCRLHGAGRAG